MSESDDLSPIAHEAERLILTRVVERMKSPDLDDKAHRLMCNIYCDVQKQSASRLRAAVSRDLLKWRMDKARPQDPEPITPAQSHAIIRQAVIDAYGDDFYPDYAPESPPAEPAAPDSDSAPLKTAHSFHMSHPPTNDSHADLLICTQPRPAREARFSPDHPARFIKFPVLIEDSPSLLPPASSHNISPDTG